MPSQSHVISIQSCAELSAADHDMALNMFEDVGIPMDDTFQCPPFGEEAFDFSHEGGEHEAFAGLAEEVAKSRP